MVAGASTAALDFVKAVLSVIELDATVSREIENLRDDLLRILGVSSFSADAIKPLPGFPKKSGASTTTSTDDQLITSFVLPEVICLHCNAEEWGDPAHPQLTDKNHLHLLVNGNYHAGELALADNNLAVAVPAYEQALALDPDDAFLLSRLSIGEYRLQHYAKALDYFDKLAKLTPEAPGTRYLRMDILEKLGRDADLIPLYTAQIEKAPNSAFLLTKRAAAYLRLGKTDLAAKDTAAADEATRHAPPVVVVPPPVPGRPVVTVPPPQVVVVPPPA